MIEAIWLKTSESSARDSAYSVWLAASPRCAMPGSFGVIVVEKERAAVGRRGVEDTRIWIEDLQILLVEHVARDAERSGPTVCTQSVEAR